ncbi:kinesin-like protein KIF22 isoform X1 [Ptychodera flava]|uniref:kinesin-like protein KIF22 isoform X1 n=1 Tax=Ptychodera flava TaxID=63121 RepID=UPI003969D789
MIIRPVCKFFAGKTFTMIGCASDVGIIPRSVNKLLSIINAEQSSTDEWNYTVNFSYLEIYQEKVYDLLEPKNHDLLIREDRERNIFIPGLAEKEITSFEQFQKLFIPASHKRTTASTKLNSRSSRSHAILLLKIVRVQQVAPFKKLTGKLFLIDLAGSEDNRRTGNHGIRLKESGAINVSLFSLGQVVDALNQGLPRIPYRDSKLTRLLQDSLGGTAHACMITNIAPEEKHYSDTYSTLNFAAKSRHIINKPFTRESTEKPKRASKRKSSEESYTLKTPPKIPRRTPDMLLTNTPFVTVRKDSAKPKNSLQPFLSPFLRRQANFAESVVTRLEILEQSILSQMRPPVEERIPEQTEQEDLLRQLEESRQQLKLLQEQNQKLKEQRLSELQNEQNSTSDCLFQKIPLVKKKSAAKLVDKSNSADGSGQPVKTKKALQNVNTQSPDLQFVKIVHTDSQGKENVTDPGQQKGWAVKLNRELQDKHNSEILHILNTGTVKQLKSLQSIGEKRANLIHGWRETHGTFSKVEDLQRVHGLTKKTVESIVKNNLLSKLMFQ